jgi:hypothetical protein
LPHFERLRVPYGSTHVSQFPIPWYRCLLPQALTRHHPQSCTGFSRASSQAKPDV